MFEILKQLSIVLTALSALLAGQFQVPVKQPVFGAIIETTIESMLEGKTQKEKANIKSAEIVKKNFVGTYNSAEYGETIEIRSIIKIDRGVEIIARAWKGIKQLGFSPDGSVEWERFIIHNPPIMVDDPNGTVIRTWTRADGTTGQRKLREDPVASVKSDLAHIISITGKENTKINKGSVGHTIETFRPDANPETTSVDGYVAIDDPNPGSIWSTIRGGTGNAQTPSAADASGASMILMSTTADQFRTLVRYVYLFDTTSIPAGNNIASSTISLRGTNAYNTTGNSPAVNIYSSAPASNTDLVGSTDYAVASWGSTAFSNSNITVAAWSTTGYNNFILNASGITNITKGGISKFGVREAVYEVANSAPTWASGGNYSIDNYFADTAGTDNDPKLVVDHSSAEAGGKGLKIIIMSLLEQFIKTAQAK